MNILFVSHCDFVGNSAMHLFNIANCLSKLNVCSVVSVPHDPALVRDHGTPRFQVQDHEKTKRDGVAFPDGRGPDLVHAWTPRELVRLTTESIVARYGCAYLVHLEDNEDEIVASEFPSISFSELAALPNPILDRLILPWRSHPRRSKEFIASSSGMTALIDRLLEFKPAGLPGVVFWPGYEAAFLPSDTDQAQLRQRIGLTQNDRVLVYNGSIHLSNEKDFRSLVLAIVILNRSGIRARLVKTGVDHVGKELLDDAIREGFVIDLGFVPREEVATLIHLADVLVQPGHTNAFNDYRFPSKLPEFFAARKPVVLAKTNLGRCMKDGVECLLLERGDAADIAEKVARIIRDPELSTNLANAGHRFALAKFDWAKNVESIVDLYRQVLKDESTKSSAPPLKFLEPPSPVKLIAFYLPQFHPIPENDEWWGKGFTEWTTVTKAKPVYPGHHQPQLPSDLGFYDLRVPEVMQKQAALAQENGIFGFCLYYYWFDGRKVLDLPLRQLLASGKPDFPFCLCWANENWTRTWDGQANQVLLEQKYSPEGDERLMEELAPVFNDSRYIRMDGAPLFLVYRVNDLPDPAATAHRWRGVCARHGIPHIHLAAVQSFGVGDPRPFGFDSAVEFPPHVKKRLVATGLLPSVSPEFRGDMEDYLALVANQIQEPLTPYVRYRGVMPAWDNSARRGNQAHIVIRSSPALYRRWLSAMVEQTMSLREIQEPLVFINAWNEWAEGAHLEPDQRYGRAFLNATKSGLLSGIAEHCRKKGLSISDNLV